MESINANGASLSLALFIKTYRMARKLAPARFMTMRLHPSTFEELNRLHADVTEIVQVGEMAGHLGKRNIKIACVPAPNGLGDGVTVIQDEEADRSKIEFQIHGATELEIVNLLSTRLERTENNAETEAHTSATFRVQ